MRSLAFTGFTLFLLKRREFVCDRVRKLKCEITLKVAEIIPHKMFFVLNALTVMSVGY